MSTLTSLIVYSLWLGVNQEEKGDKENLAAGARKRIYSRRNVSSKLRRN